MLCIGTSSRLFCIVLLCAPTICAAEDKTFNGIQPSAEAVPEWKLATDAISELQREQRASGNSLLIQAELNFLIDKDGGGACASAAGVNLLQTLRTMAGIGPLPNLHRVALKSFSAQPHLLKGRVTNRQFVQLVESYQPYLNAKPAVDVESASNSAYREGARLWPSADGPELVVRPREVKVLSFTVTQVGGSLLGRHFVLLKECQQKEITVVDPSDPVKNYRYVVEKKVDAGEASRFFLVRPAGAPPGNHVRELNTIFTVLLSAEVGKQQGLVAPSVDEMKRKIDHLANELRTTKDFLSPRVWRERSATFGLPGLDLPVVNGGSGWSASKILEVFRHAGTHNLNFRDVVGGAHVRPLLKSNNPKVLEIVQQVAAGKGYVAIAITEPSAGTDIPAIKSTARKVEGGFCLTGTKMFNARLNQATHVILFTQGTAAQPGKLSVFVVPIDTPGLKIEQLTAHGLVGNSFGGLSFNDLFVPDGNLIGEDGEGLRIFFEHFLYWRLMQTAAAIGTGENALEQMANRLKTREVFGGPIGRFTHLQQPLGQYTTQLRMAYALAKDAAEMIDAGDYVKARPIICGLKAEGVEAALSAVDSAMRAHGGEGYSTLVDLGDRLNDLNGLRIADGTTDVMRMEVVRHTFGEEFWKMGVISNE